MKDPTSLPSADLARIVADIQAFLWLDVDRDAESFWNPEKEWDFDTVENIAGLLSEFGLEPVAPSPTAP
jgi:hypothetical protein